jgi:hypothetical protein
LEEAVEVQQVLQAQLPQAVAEAEEQADAFRLVFTLTTFQLYQLL